MSETDEQFVERMAQTHTIASREEFDRLVALTRRVEQAAEIERLRAALRPFACKCSVKGMGAGGNCTRGTGECDCWNARAALDKEKRT